MKRVLIATSFLLVAAIWAVAQVPGLFIASPTGLEQINVLVPSSGTIVTNPQIQTVTLNQARNAVGHALVAAGTTVTSVPTNAVAELIADGAITTWNVKLPVAPWTGERIIINCPGGTVSTLTITASLPAGVAIVGTNPTSCTSGGAITNGSAWIYSTAANTWFRYL